MNETTIRIEWNRGKSYLEMDLSMILPATPANMNRIIDTICQADCDMWETYAGKINEYIRGKVADLAVLRGGLDQKRMQKKIADYNREIKRFINNSAALAKRFDVEAVKDQTVNDIPKMKKATVECLQKDPDCGYKNIVTTHDGFTFEYKGYQFDICQDRPAHWKILLHGTGVMVTYCRNKTDAYLAINDDIITFLNSDKGRDNVQAARNDYLKAKGMEPETEPETETIETSPAAAPEQAAETLKNTEVETMNENKTTTTATEPETKKESIDVSALTPENIGDYLPALLMSLANDKHNTAIILAAGVEAGVIPPTAILTYYRIGTMPAVHTFDAWKQAGYTVRKGEKAAFTARIWKHVEKAAGTFTAEEAAELNSMMINADGSDMVQAGDEKISYNFIKKLAFFFTASQVEKTPEPAPLPELPADVKQETRRGCEWISGNTRPIKESLKAAGFRWSKKQAAWYRKAA